MDLGHQNETSKLVITSIPYIHILLPGASNQPSRKSYEPKKLRTAFAYHTLCYPDGNASRQLRLYFLRAWLSPPRRNCMVKRPIVPIELHQGESSNPLPSPLVKVMVVCSKVPTLFSRTRSLDAWNLPGFFLQVDFRTPMKRHD